MFDGFCMIKKNYSLKKMIYNMYYFKDDIGYGVLLWLKIGMICVNKIWLFCI